MRIEVDPEVCTGHGRCYTLAPEVYDADDDGYCATRSLDVPPHLEEQAMVGVRSCPERAIRVVDDRGAAR
jgi:ferredoxin